MISLWHWPAGSRGPAAISKRAQATQVSRIPSHDSKTGKLWRSFRAAVPVERLLDDYTDLISGLLDLYQAGFDVHWLTWAVSLQEKQDQQFGDAKEAAISIGDI